ncbi:hypothetical protein [Lacticaseibacillus sp. N501-2]|uniref:hypothetical protein n=1 Tax=Lacticaseibacillus salsurae TaxID=3367729 RepID=UPI0038B38BE7
MAKFDNAELLSHWQENPDEMKKLTQHLRMRNKHTLTQVLAAGNPGRLLGCRVRKAGELTVVSAPHQAQPLLPALLAAMGPAAETLPDFLAKYYPEVVQREDFVEAIKRALANRRRLQKVSDSRTRQVPASQHVLFQTYSKADPNRLAKRALVDVAQAVYLAVANVVSGRQLAWAPGSGFYETRAAIRACMQRPNELSDEQLSNALVVLRIAGMLKLAAPEELTAAGQRLAMVREVAGNMRPSHRVFVVTNFEEVHWETFAASFRLALNVRIGRSAIAWCYGEAVAQQNFADLSGGVPENAIAWLQQRVAQTPPAQAVGAYQSLAKQLHQLLHVSLITARKYLDQALLLKEIAAVKLTQSQAQAAGCELAQLINNPAEKVVVPQALAAQVSAESAQY